MSSLIKDVYLFKSGDAKIEAYVESCKNIHVPDDIQELIYTNYLRTCLTEEIKKKSKNPIFYNATRDEGRSKSLFQIVEENLQHRLTTESWYALSTILLSVEHSGLWKYATKETKTILVDEIKSSRLYTYEVHFKFCTSRQVDFETCILHIIYMNEHGMDKYFEKVNKEWFRWGGHESTELWNKH
jgi:hypothetical protein